MRMTAVREACVVSIRRDAQEFRVDERIKHHLAEHPLDAAQSLCLFECQSQAWHFQILAPDTYEQRGVRHDNLSISLPGGGPQSAWRCGFTRRTDGSAPRPVSSSTQSPLCSLNHACTAS